MKIATIVPTSYLELTETDKYLMALAHLIKPGEKYADFFRTQSMFDKFIIMDNGAAEKAQQPWDVILARACYINATEIILPDTIYDSKKTLEDSELFLRQCIDAKYPFRYMAVPQGETFEEWSYCARQMLDWPIHTLGISKFMTPKMGAEIRMRAVASLRAAPINIHLLGCWEDPKEPGFIAHNYNVRGVDSAIAYAYTRKRQYLEAGSRPSPEEEIDFNDSLAERQLLKANIATWKRCCLNEL